MPGHCTEEPLGPHSLDLVADMGNGLAEDIAAEDILDYIDLEVRSPAEDIGYMGLTWLGRFGNESFVMASGSDAILENG